MTCTRSSAVTSTFDKDCRIKTAILIELNYWLAWVLHFDYLSWTRCEGCCILITSTEQGARIVAFWSCLMNKVRGMLHFHYLSWTRCERCFIFHNLSLTRCEECCIFHYFSWTRCEGVTFFIVSHEQGARDVAFQLSVMNRVW
jgi:hypothetical protein